MEKHIFKFGEKSWAIVVPKSWVERSMIDEKSTVRLYEDAQGNLIVSTKAEASKEAELFLDSKIAPDAAARLVGMHYRLGTSTLKVYVDDTEAGSRQLEAITKLVGSLCPGFEVIKRSHKEMMLQDFTNVQQITFDTLLARFKSLISEEFDGMQNGNLKAIADLEGLVNRFFMLGIRYLSLTHGTEELSRFKALQLLETISDQMNVLSKDQSISKNKALFDQLGEEFKTCFDGFNGNYESIKSALEIKNSILKSVARLRLGDLQRYLIIEISKNISKIAELGLEQGANGMQRFAGAPSQ